MTKSPDTHTETIDSKSKEIIDRMREEYLTDSRPWVVTFSGGKDSTTVLHLVVEMLMGLQAEGIELKKTYVVSSDTGVEMPVIHDYTLQKLDTIDMFAKRTELNMDVNLLRPSPSDGFWGKLIGLGYPSPNQTFRWCSDRLKIRPATKFLTSLTKKNDSILMLLGVRSDESASRAMSINKREENHRGFSKHNDIPNAFIFSPIKHWTNADVWSYLSSKPAVWGTHDDMMRLYDKGSSEADCNIALNPNSESCGKTRFGCYVCTVVSKDKSMENMLKNKEDQWMYPLHEFRNKLEAYRDTKGLGLVKRQSHRRNGQKSIGPFLLSTRKEFLSDLLLMEKDMRDAGHLGSKFLVTDEEIVFIQNQWQADGDFFESAIKMAAGVGRNIPFASPKSFSPTERGFIGKLCDEKEIPVKLIEEIIEKEHGCRHHSRRTKIFAEIESLVENFANGVVNEF